VDGRGLVPGTRVVVRHRLPSGSATDALGELTDNDDTGLVVLTRRGPVRIAHADVIAAKPVSPPPERIRRPPDTR
jgi:N-acetylglutamate synthase